MIADQRAVDISSAVSRLNHGSPQLLMADIIIHFCELRPELERLAGAGGRPLAEVRLRPPLPRPSKILCSGRYTHS